MADTPVSRERLQAALDGRNAVSDPGETVEDNFHWRLVQAMYEDYNHRLVESGGGPVPALRQVLLSPEQYAALHEQAPFQEWTVGAGGGKESWRGLRVVVVEDALDATGIPL